MNIDQELHFDCKIWRVFLENFRNRAVCRPMNDPMESITAEQLSFFSDASAAEHLDLGAVFGNHWLFGQWPVGFIKGSKPSIEYLELFALTAALMTWGHMPMIQNKRVILFCDNMSVVNMINNSSSSCKNCMYLLRLITLNNLVNNRRVFAKHICTERNNLADSLS